MRERRTLPLIRPQQHCPAAALEHPVFPDEIPGLQRQNVSRVLSHSGACARDHLPGCINDRRHLPCRNRTSGLWGNTQ